MNLATWGIRNPVPVVLVFVLLAIAGVRGFLQLPIQDLPDLALPVVNIVLEQPGAAPAQLETEVARKVEDSVADVAGVRHLRTTITDGIVQVSAEFEIGKPLSEALADTKEAVDRIRSDLPEDVLQAAVSAESTNGDPVLTYAVQAPGMDEEALSWLVDDVIAKALDALPGVGRVQRVGGVEREVRIEVDPARLDALGITATDVSRALSQVHRDASGGRAQIGGAEQSVRTLATVRQAAGLANLPITVAGGRHVRLGDIATVTDGHADRSQAALLDGKAVVGFRLYRARGKDATVVAEQAARVLEEIAHAYPGLRITFVSGTVANIREQFQGSMQMLLEGAFLAVLVVWWFLRDWRATLVAATALPLSILSVFALMPWIGFSLNTLTLLALAVATGILVDDAIVEIENIERHRRLGKSIRKATSDAVTEIALPVLATTFTLVVVFVPTAMMPGVPGLLFAQFGWTAAIAILASLLVARLLIPLLAVHWLDAAPAKAGPSSRGMELYLKAVAWSLDHRKATTALAAAFLIGSAGLLPLLSTGFLPASDDGVVQIGVELPPGTSLQTSVRTVERVRSEVADLPGVAHVFAALGEPQGDGRQSADVRQSTLTLSLKPRGERPSQRDVEQAVLTRLAKVPGARFTIGGDEGGVELSLILAGNDARVLEATALTLERQMRGIPGLSSVRSTASLERPALTIRPDAQRAAELGVDTAAIAETVRIATSGDFDARLPKLNLDNRQVAVRVRLPDAARDDLEQLRNLRVPSAVGTVPLGNLASLTIESGPQQLDRYDRQRYVTVSAGLGGIPLGDATAAVAALPVMQSLPAGVSVMPAGSSELAAELADGFATALVTGLLCMVCVLVLLFKDVFQPITILSAVPLSIGGAFLALLVTGSSLDVPALIGLVMLMGIVTKNSILLVEYAVLGIRGGMTRQEALVDACRARARPIVMTTLAMIAGMAPIALGLGADASFRQPMAITVIGGLVTSTLLSLLLVPVVFTWLDDAEAGLGRAWQRRPGTRRQIDEPV